MQFKEIESQCAKRSIVAGVEVRVFVLWWSGCVRVLRMIAISQLLPKITVAKDSARAKAERVQPQAEAALKDRLQTCDYWYISHLGDVKIYNRGKILKK
jgi:hypothetical protein